MLIGVPVSRTSYYHVARKGGTSIDAFRHSVRLLGPGARGRRISGAVLRDLLDVLVDGSRGAVRLHAEGTSFSAGPTPGWLAKAADFEVLPLEEGSTVVPLAAYPLAVTAPERFAQESLVDPVSKRSGLSLFEEGLGLALAGDEEAEAFDQSLLKRFQGFSRFLDAGIDTIEITSDEEIKPAGPRCLRIEEADLDTVDELIRKTPPPQRTRLAGTLDMIRHHDRMFALKLASGQTVKGIAARADVDSLATHWGQHVIVHGLATFRPAGTVLRIEADAIEEAEDADVDIWSQSPKPIFHTLDDRSIRQEQGPRSGLNAIHGKWPGDESDEEIAAALAEIS